MDVTVDIKSITYNQTTASQWLRLDIKASCELLLSLCENPSAPNEDLKLSLCLCITPTPPSFVDSASPRRTIFLQPACSIRLSSLGCIHFLWCFLFPIPSSSQPRLRAIVHLLRLFIIKPQWNVDLVRHTKLRQTGQTDQGPGVGYTLGTKRRSNKSLK